MSAASDSLISQFIDLTNASHEEAKSFLESSNNDLDVAVNNFLSMKYEDEAP